MGRVDAMNPHLVEIGDMCVIGTESILLTHGPGLDGSRKTIVGDYTYIGYRVTVLPGVTIGPGCIIGAGAVVTRDVPAGKVAAGCPARVLRAVTVAEAADIRHRMNNDLHFSGPAVTVGTKDVAMRTPVGSVPARVTRQIAE